MTVLPSWTVLAVLESTLLSWYLSHKLQSQETTVTVLTVLAVSAVAAVSVVTATPLNSTPLFRHPDFCLHQLLYLATHSPSFLWQTWEKKTND